MRRILPFAVMLVLLSLGHLFAEQKNDPATTQPAANPPPASQPATQPAKLIPIDIDKAVKVALPDINTDLTPVGFKTGDGRAGWVVRIPGSRPIATPAYAMIDGRGMLFVGGGYGSHEFYAFDAGSGEKVWQIQTNDDGPSAAVTEDGYVAFNTESCTILVVDAKTGREVWKEWLGDPLMSQPAISKGKLYMAYPGGGRGQAENQQAAVQAAKAPGENQGAGEPDAKQPAGNQPMLSHRLLCADLKSGKHLWVQPISGDVISAPIIDGDRVYCTCFDGTSYCLDGENGRIIWKKENSGTSAPVIANGQMVISQKQMRAGKAYEGIRRIDPAKGDDTDKVQLAQSKAGYLEQGAGGNGGIDPAQAKALDSSVGFAAAPQSAALFSAGANVNVNSVAQAWAFQGSKAAYKDGRLLNAQGSALNCIDAITGQARWQGVARGKEIGQDTQIFAPPALGVKNMYLCSTLGHLLSVSQEDGKVLFAYSFQQPMAFQPALSGGNFYAPTTNGLLICLRTNDNDADGWTAWGGNAQHNKTK